AADEERQLEHVELVVDEEPKGGRAEDQPGRGVVRHPAPAGEPPGHPEAEEGGPERPREEGEEPLLIEYRPGRAERPAEPVPGRARGLEEQVVGVEAPGPGGEGPGIAEPVARHPADRHQGEEEQPGEPEEGVAAVGSQARLSIGGTWILTEYNRPNEIA